MSAPPVTPYAPPEDALDETLAVSAKAQDRYADLLAEISERGAKPVRERIQAAMGREGVCFRSTHGRKPFRVDPVPRVLDSEEWARLERGLAQRASALEAFVRDAYSEQRIVAAGELPERVLADSQLYDERLRGVEVPNDAYVFVYGPDLVRDASGEMLVLEDNMRTPSGISYLLAIRDALTAELGSELHGVRELDPELHLLRDALRLGAPEGTEDDPAVAVITDGRGSPAFYEHCEAARRIDAPLLTLEEVEAKGGELCFRDEDGNRRRIDVLYRRTDEAAFTAQDGGLTPLGEKLRGPIEAGRLGVANAFGAGIGDDKLTHAYTEAMVRFYLGEEPLLRSARTFDLVVDEQREEVLERLEDLVIKQRHRAGGIGVLVEPEEAESGMDVLRKRIEDDPAELVAQERISISTHPTVGEDGYEPRRVDLRPFIVRTADGWEGVPGGLTRFAATREALVVNSTQGGGGKDTWVLE